MPGWGRRLAGGEGEEPKTLNEAQLTALMTIADRIYGVEISLKNIEARLLRVERWLDTNVASYRQTSAYRSLDGEQPRG